MQKLAKRSVDVLALTALIVVVNMFMPVQAQPHAVNAATVSNEPTTAATTCPAPTADGAYNQIGTDPSTGKAICKFAWSNACPYSEAVSASDPMCYKNQPQQPTAPVSNPITPATPELKQPVVSQCGGK